MSNSHDISSIPVVLRMRLWHYRLHNDDDFILNADVAYTPTIHTHELSVKVCEAAAAAAMPTCTIYIFTASAAARRDILVWHTGIAK